MLMKVLPTGSTSNSLGERNDSQSIIHDGSATVIFWTLSIPVSLLLTKINMTWSHFILLLHTILFFFLLPLSLFISSLHMWGESFTLHYINCSFTKLTFVKICVCAVILTKISCVKQGICISVEENRICFGVFCFSHHHGILALGNFCRLKKSKPSLIRKQRHITHLSYNAVEFEDPHMVDFWLKCG